MKKGIVIGLVALLGASILAGTVFLRGPRVSPDVKAFAKEFRSVANSQTRMDVLERHTVWEEGLEGLSGRTVRRLLGPPDITEAENKHEVLYYHIAEVKGDPCDFIVVLDEKRRVAMTIYH